jgi:hypothetical protein
LNQKTIALLFNKPMNLRLPQVQVKYSSGFGLVAGIGVPLGTRWADLTRRRRFQKPVLHH